MSQGMAKSLRLLTQGEKEVKNFNFPVYHPAVKLSSQLESGQPRKKLLLYNPSGEVWMGDENVTNASGYPLKVAEPLDIPVADDVDLYFITRASGEIVNLRVLEIA